MAYNKHCAKKIGLLIGICLCMSVGSLKAQSVDQLIEQLMLDIQKLSELKTILKDMRDGYQVLDNGYTNIRDIVKGNFNLHKTFLDGLLDVSLPVRQYYKAADIIDKERNIVTECRTANQYWISCGLFTHGELAHIERTYKTLSDRSSQCLDRLTIVITADELRMSDAERMQAIDQIHTTVTEQLVGLRRFNDAVSIQALQRQREQNNLQTLKKIYGNFP